MVHIEGSIEKGTVREVSVRIATPLNDKIPPAGYFTCTSSEYVSVY
jgi:hypothetical protein